MFDTAKSILKRDPAAKSLLEVILLYPGYHAILYHRVAHFLYKNHLFFLARLVSQINRGITGVEILGNIHIGDNAKIGANCIVIHDVEAGKTVVGVPGEVLVKK